jgi:hypothetical protein
MVESTEGFGLGYLDGPDGAVGHHLWMRPHMGDVEAGPYAVSWTASRNDDELLELLALVKSLEDQIPLVKIFEPPGVQLQALVDRPMFSMWTTRNAKYETRYRVYTWWQARICDLAACLERTRLPGPEVRFTLEVTDPIERLLGEGEAWRGVGGSYVVTLGSRSSAERGADASLPTMRTTVNAFTRLWLGVRPASGLAITDSIDAPTELLTALDEAIVVPRPCADWMF